MRGRPKQRTAFSAEEIAKYAMRLHPHHHAILSLANNLSYDGLAADLNISLGTVKSRLSRARAEIARLIEEDANAGS